jgi:hypothetical protein
MIPIRKRIIIFNTKKFHFFFLFYLIILKKLNEIKWNFIKKKIFNFNNFLAFA